MDDSDDERLVRVGVGVLVTEPVPLNVRDAVPVWLSVTVGWTVWVSVTERLGVPVPV